jgi:hypothetical protein
MRNIRRAIQLQGRARINGYHRTMTWQDLEAAAGLVDASDEKERMREIAKALAARTLRGELSAHWWLPLDEISYIGVFDDRDSMLNGYSLEDGLLHQV